MRIARENLNIGLRFIGWLDGLGWVGKRALEGCDFSEKIAKKY